MGVPYILCIVYKINGYVGSVFNVCSIGSVCKVCSTGYIGSISYVCYVSNICMQCSQNRRFAGIWAGAAKRIPEPFSEYSEGNLKFKSREAAFLGPFWLEMSEVQSKNFTHTQQKRKGKQLVDCVI